MPDTICREPWKTLKIAACRIYVRHTRLAYRGFVTALAASPSGLLRCLQGLLELGAHLVAGFGAPLAHEGVEIGHGPATLDDLRGAGHQLVLGDDAQAVRRLGVQADGRIRLHDRDH